MLLLLATLQLVTIARATVPFKERSIEGNYKLKMKSVEVVYITFHYVRQKLCWKFNNYRRQFCNLVFGRYMLFCRGLLKTSSNEFLGNLLPDPPPPCKLCYTTVLWYKSVINHYPPVTQCVNGPWEIKVVLLAHEFIERIHHC